MGKNVKEWSFKVLVLILMLTQLTSCQLLNRQELSESDSTQGSQLQRSDVKSSGSDKEKGSLSLGFPNKSNDSGSQNTAALNSANKKIGLILGPGGAKSLAGIGVIKELQKAKIPIHEVVGIEWGALVGGLFSIKGQSHEAEWKLYKLEKVDLPTVHFLTHKMSVQKVEVLKSFLKDNINSMDLKFSAIPFACPYQIRIGETRWIESQQPREDLESCLGYPPLFEANDQKWAQVFAVQEAVERLKRNGINLIILVNVLNAGILIDSKKYVDAEASQFLWAEVRGQMRAASLKVEEYLEVDTSAFGLEDFKKRRDLGLQGEKAGQILVKRLSQKYGF